VYDQLQDHINYYHAAWPILLSYPHSQWTITCIRVRAPLYIKTNTKTIYSRTPTTVTIHPVALFSILDHYLRRKDDQDRVIGTLLGVRVGATSVGETETVEVRSSFAVLHSETSEQVAVDMEYHRTMYELHHKVNPREVIVGW
jgi:translation initiation factor 3 subunit F